MLLITLCVILDGFLFFSIFTIMKQKLLTTLTLATVIGVSGFASVMAADATNVFGDTTYKANEGISRAETATVLVNFLLKTEGEVAFNERADHTYKCDFSDISTLDATTAEKVKLACSHGLFKGHEGKFSPDTKLTWAQSLALLARIDNANITEGKPWWTNYQNYAVKKGWLKTKDIIKADQNITQAQFAGLLANFVKAEEVKTVNNLADTSWTLVSFDGKTVTGNYVLDFTKDALHTKLCNVINGGYTLENEVIKGNFISTLMACMDAEPTALEGAFKINGAKYFIIEDKSLKADKTITLKITTPEGKVFTYTKNTPETKTAETPAIKKTALTDTTWELKEFNGKAVSGNYVMAIDANNKLNTKFCNTMNGQITVSGENLNALLMSTKMACVNDEAQTLEGKFNLEGAKFLIVSTKMVDNNIEKLTITTKNGDIYAFIKSAPVLSIAGEYGIRTLNGEAVSGTYLVTITKDSLSTKFCNNINGGYTLEGNLMKGNLISTLMACTDTEKTDLENKFSINNATIVKEGVDKLTLTTEKGDIFGLVKIYR